VDVLPLGADGAGVDRQGEPSEVREPARPPRIVCVGILEPRKNQALLLEACRELRAEGLDLELDLVGRVNPHFGGPIAKRVAELSALWPGLRHHADLDDPALVALIRSARATAFPSIAEGCGLPVMESLWLGVPCLCSDIDPLKELSAGGGCAVIAGNNLDGWKAGLRRILTDDEFHGRLAAEAAHRTLPTWANSARLLRESLV
jgi:glycosyltransferase involved in cell wall biosynthesis